MDDKEYEKNNIGYDAQYPEGGIKCRNYEVCNEILPDWWKNCKGKWLCTNCDMMFGSWSYKNSSGENIRKNGKGILNFRDDEDCVICLETKRCVSQPNCDHFLCIDCFKRCYYGDDMSDLEPPFPYPEIEDEYYEDTDNERWNEYPLIEIYQNAWNAWDDYKQMKYESEEHLRNCPICRSNNNGTIISPRK